MKKIALITILGIAGIGLIAFLLYRRLSTANLPVQNPEFQPIVSTSTVATHDPCLKGDEYADFPLSEKRNTVFNWPSSSSIDIYVKDQNANKLKSTFQITEVQYHHYHPLEFHLCGVYVLREFGQDARKSFPVGYHVDLWKYDYSSNGVKLLTMLEIGQNQKEINHYYPDFRIDPAEHYLALDQGYQQPNEALVIKDPATLKDLFILPFPDIAKQNPNVVGVFSFGNGGWSHDGRYIWYDFDDPADPADVMGFVRVDTSDWSYKIFRAPLVTMGGDAFNSDTGMTTYNTNVAPWTADADADQYYRDQAKAKGQITSFYIYNLLTKQNYLVATTTDPTYYFRPKWLSNTVLQYTLPSGATTTYVVSK